MRNFFGAAMAAACLFLVPSANAAVVSFDFTGTTGEASSMSFTQDGVMVTVTAGGVQSSLGAILPPLVTGNLEGLGAIAGPGTSFGADGIREINSARSGGIFPQSYANFVTLTFASAVSFVSADFEGFIPPSPGVFGGDVFNFAVDGATVASQITADPFLAANFLSPAEANGRSFQIMAGFTSVPGLSFPSSFYLAGVTVSTSDDAMPIPLPAGLPLYLGAVALLLTAGRSRPARYG